MVSGDRFIQETTLPPSYQKFLNSSRTVRYVSSYVHVRGGLIDTDSTFNLLPMVIRVPAFDFQGSIAATYLIMTHWVIKPFEGRLVNSCRPLGKVAKATCFQFSTNWYIPTTNSGVCTIQQHKYSTAYSNCFEFNIIIN